MAIGTKRKHRSTFRWIAIVLSALMLTAGIGVDASRNSAQAADVFSINVATKAGAADNTRTTLDFGAMDIAQVKTDSVLVQNKGDKALSFAVFARYSYDSPTGVGQLITANETDPYDMAQWALFGATKVPMFSLSLKPGASAVVPVQITVPKEALPGMHDAAVVVATAAGTGTVSVSKRVALYMSAQVPGDLKPAANPSWMSDSVFYEANIRQFSTAKNFVGATAKVTDLKTLGVEALVLDPIFPIGKLQQVGTIGDVFAANDLGLVNPSLGTLANFKTFAAAVKKAGIKLILTVPIDSMAIDSQWVVDHPNWFLRDKDYNLVVDPTAPYLADFDYSQFEVRQAVIEELKYWVNTEGVDGFMLQGATNVPVDFVNELTYRLQANKSLMIGTNDAQKAPYFVNSLAVTRNDALLRFMENLDDGLTTVASFTPIVAGLRDSFKPPTIALNILSNYNTMVSLKTETARFGAALPMAAALQFTLPGAPMIFQGQEVGSIKALKPYDADSIVWPTKAPTVLATYIKLIKLKRLNTALFNGSAGADPVILTSASPGLFAFKRTLGKNSVIVVVNLTKKALTAKFNPGAAASMFAFSTDKAIKLAATGQAVTIPALGYEIYTPAVVK